MKLNRIANNFHSVTLDNGATVWFSYETPVALHYPGAGYTVRANVWGTTTGKHLNQIDGGDKQAKALRVDGPTFEATLKAAQYTPSRV